jgi:hypothetical protein
MESTGMGYMGLGGKGISRYAIRTGLPIVFRKKSKTDGYMKKTKVRLFAVIFGH